MKDLLDFSFDFENAEKTDLFFGEDLFLTLREDNHTLSSEIWSTFKEEFLGVGSIILFSIFFTVLSRKF